MTDWIKAIAFDAMKLSDRKVRGSVPGLVKVYGGFFIQEQSTIFTSKLYLSKETKFDQNC